MTCPTSSVGAGQSELATSGRCRSRRAPDSTRRRSLQPPEYVALVLAVGLALALLALGVGAALELADPHGHLSDQATQLLSTVLGAVAGGLAGYLGKSTR